MSNYKMYYSRSNNKPSYKITTSTDGTSNNTAYGLPTASSQNPLNSTRSYFGKDVVQVPAANPDNPGVAPPNFKPDPNWQTHPPGTIIDNVAGGLGTIIDASGKALGNITGGLTMPITIGLAVGGVVLVLILLKK